MGSAHDDSALFYHHYLLSKHCRFVDGHKKEEENYVLGSEKLILEYCNYGPSVPTRVISYGN